MRPPADQHVIKAIVDLAIFLEFTGPEDLDEDAAVRAMEQLASELQCLDDQARLELSKRIKVLSTAYADAKTREFVSSLPEALGLVG
jgi:hypothetical protein